MRTNVVLDESLVEKAKVLTGIKTTRAVIDEALHLLIQLREQIEARDLRGRLRGEGDLSALREARTVAYDVTAEGSPRQAASGETSLRLIQMTIEEPLLTEVDRVSQTLKTNRSEFIREALTFALQRQRIFELERRHADGYARYPVHPQEFAIAESDLVWGDS